MVDALMSQLIWPGAMGGISSLLILMPSLTDDAGFLAFLVFGWVFVGMTLGFWLFSVGCYLAALMIAGYALKKNWNKMKKKVLDVYVAHI